MQKGFSAVELAAAVITFIANTSAERIVGGTRRIWLVLVPATPGRCNAHFKLVIFGHAPCYGNAEGDDWGSMYKHDMATFVRALFFLLARPWSARVWLHGVKHKDMAAQLSTALNVDYYTPQAAGGGQQNACVTCGVDIDKFPTSNTCINHQKPTHPNNTCVTCGVDMNKFPTSDTCLYHQKWISVRQKLSSESRHAQRTAASNGQRVGRTPFCTDACRSVCCKP
jgi:hypothetical protein